MRSSSSAGGHDVAPRLNHRSRSVPCFAATHILQLEDHEDDAARDTHVGDVEHRPELEVDEVDHVPGHEPVRSTDEAVDDVADRTSEDQRDADGRDHRAGLAGETDEHDDHDARDHAEERTFAFTQTERGAGIAHQIQPQLPHHVDRVIVERGSRPDLGDLIERRGARAR